MNNIGLVKLRKLHDRAEACGALENYRDAYRDLVKHPEEYEKILADLTKAIKAHEEPEIDDDLDDFDTDEIWPDFDETMEDV